MYEGPTKIISMFFSLQYDPVVSTKDPVDPEVQHSFMVCLRLPVTNQYSDNIKFVQNKMFKVKFWNFLCLRVPKLIFLSFFSPIFDLIDPI